MAAADDLLAVGIGLVVIAILVLIMCVCANKNRRSADILRYDAAREPDKEQNYGGHGGTEAALWDYEGPSDSQTIIKAMQKRKQLEEMKPHQMITLDEGEEDEVAGPSEDGIRSKYSSGHETSRL
eukprot:sb/3475681/